MRIAIFDYRVMPNNPTGSCHRRMLEGLCDQHEFTVFATEFDNPRPDRIKFVKIPAIRRPLALLFLVFHVMAPIVYWLHRLLHFRKFDLVQMVESNLTFGDLCYAHFCHRRFLRDHREQLSGKGLAVKGRLLDHWLHAKMEPWVYRHVKEIVVPSEGLARELRAEYPYTEGKITVLSNPVDVQRMQKPPGFDRATLRRQWGLSDNDLVIAFVALGHFERKGLPHLLEALKLVPSPQLKLLIVGGRDELVASYRARCEQMHIADRVVFAGSQKDVRPFLWASDAFTLPSFYEVFPLVALEAAAAGLPLLVTPLNGVEEFLVNGENGILVNPTVPALDAGLRRLADTAPADRAVIGENAAHSVARFRTQEFVRRWGTVYAR